MVCATIPTSVPETLVPSFMVNVSADANWASDTKNTLIAAVNTIVLIDLSLRAPGTP